MTYTFLQHYWWLLISLLGGLLVLLLFVQGGQSLLHSLGRTPQERASLSAATGRKWEITFTTLVTFGGAFFASFPLFYSTSFGGAYWVWMLILLTFVVQAVSYEFPTQAGNLLGQRGYRLLLLLNGVLGPLLLGAAVGTLFNGAEFTVSQTNLANAAAPVVSQWASPWHGLEALANPWNWVLGLAVLFLARYLGGLYFLLQMSDTTLQERARRSSRIDGGAFLILFVGFLAHLLTMESLAPSGSGGELALTPLRHLHTLLAYPWILALLLLGVVLVLVSAVRTWFSSSRRGLWWGGAGTVLAVMALLLLAGWDGGAYYPSLCQSESSLTIYNSSSSQFTLSVMAVASLFIPLVVAYIAYCWRALDR